MNRWLLEIYLDIDYYSRDLSRTNILKLIEYANSRRFLLAKHIALLDPDVKAPEYLEEHLYMDPSSLVRPELEARNPDANVVNLESVNILRDILVIDNTGMDLSQMAACKSMLTKRVAIVQGPPGTGRLSSPSIRFEPWPRTISQATLRLLSRPRQTMYSINS